MLKQFKYNMSFLINLLGEFIEKTAPLITNKLEFSSCITLSQAHNISYRQRHNLFCSCD